MISNLHYRPSRNIATNQQGWPGEGQNAAPRPRKLLLVHYTMYYVNCTRLSGR